MKRKKKEGEEERGGRREEEKCFEVERLLVTYILQIPSVKIEKGGRRKRKREVFIFLVS